MPNNYYRVSRIEYTYLVAESPEALAEKLLQGYGISEKREGIFDYGVITAEEFFQALARIPDYEGNTYREDGTASFYNDEGWDEYRFDLEKDMWVPVGDEDCDNRPLFIDDVDMEYEPRVPLSSEYDE
jgi:hypothetical protein